MDQVEQLETAEKQEQEEELPPPPPPRRLRVVRVVTIIAIIAAFAAFFYYRDRMEELKGLGYAAAFFAGLISNATLILPLPGLAVTGVLGAVFDPVVVGIVGGVGQALGELTGYMAGYSGQTLVDENRTYDRLVRWTSQHGTLMVFFLALVPNPVFDIAGLAAGALRMPLWKYLLSCAAGKIIKNIVVALSGDLIGSIPWL